MSKLSRDAERQAASDVSSKVVYQAARRPAVLAWFLRRGWKFKFIATAVAMFLGYAVISEALNLVGLRSLPSPAPGLVTSIVKKAALKRCDDPSITIEQRAACMNEQEDNFQRSRKADREKREAERKKKADEEEVLTKERARQKNAPRRAELQPYIVQQLSLLGAGKAFPNSTEQARYHVELEDRLGELLQLTPDHPLFETFGKENFPPCKPLRCSVAKTTPPGGMKASLEADKICQSERVVGWQKRCAQYVSDNMFLINPDALRSYLRLLVVYSNLGDYVPSPSVR